MTEHLSESEPPLEKVGSRVRNGLIAIVAIALSIALFLGLQTETESASLDLQADNAIPLEVAIANGKPTSIEFYANWCTSCQAMAKDLGELRQKYGNDVNFVMLNVDNDKWLPEILRYRVDGIPHFVYLNDKGEAIAQTIGEQPRTVLQADLDALVANLPLPYAKAVGKTSELDRPQAQSTTTGSDPRSHGAQVQ